MKTCYLLLICCFSGIMAYAQQAGDVTGVWLNEEKDARIEIYQHKGSVEGKIVWLKNAFEPDGKSPRKDSKNQDVQLQKQSLLGAVILKGFRFEKGKWKGGTVYDPKNGKTYSAEMRVNGHQLELRGYVGNPIFGRTSVMTRYGN